MVVLKSSAVESSSKKSLSNDSFSWSGVFVAPLLGLLEALDDESAMALRPFFTVWKQILKPITVVYAKTITIICHFPPQNYSKWYCMIDYSWSESIEIIIAIAMCYRTFFKVNFKSSAQSIFEQVSFNTICNKYYLWKQNVCFVFKGTCIHDNIEKWQQELRQLKHFEGSATCRLLGLLTG